ncbi:hypothetical protein NHX12_012268 [Muraenolepis orangiensis]|uniref:Uncharacterized protein n=1 Tax=Muraenolepis orangiensis TaxID=630683 RepID=A0A9Q0DF42_9TELE|nr:hypothetical protein NHX12_012268 [Muraenolepis orangiensis]
MLLKTLPAPLTSSSSSSSSAAGGGEMSAGRHMLHAPVPCRPRPMKSGPLSFPWSVSEHSDWAALAASSAVQLNPIKSNPFLFANLGSASQSGPPRQPAEARSAWPKQSATAEHPAVQPPAKEPPTKEPPAKEPPAKELPAKEPARLFRVRSLSELGDSQAIALERKEMTPIQWRSGGPVPQPPRASAEGHGNEGNEGPLDLSERGRAKSNGSADSERSVFSQGPEGEEKSRADSSPRGRPSSSPPAVPTTAASSSLASGEAQELRRSGDQSNTVNTHNTPSTSRRGAHGSASPRTTDCTQLL